MKTERLYVDGGTYGKSIESAAKILKKGGIVAVPTETVYGLAAAANCDLAIKKVFEAKGRPQDNPLIVHISDMDMLPSVASEVGGRAMECAKRFWPGPFTMVLKRGNYPCESVCAGLDTVAVRMSNNPVINDIIDLAGPLAAPSSNISGRPSPTKAQHVLGDLDGKIDAVVMAEDCEVGVESTVITLVTERPKLLRPGAVTVEQLKEVLPDIEIDSAVLGGVKENERVASPGMKYKHYAPKTDTFLIEGTNEQFCEFVNGTNNRVAVCFEEESENVAEPKICYGKQDDEESLARNIFDVLRNIDDFNVKAAYIHAPSKSGVGLAVYNRLIRAAAFKVIEL